MRALANEAAEIQPMALGERRKIFSFKSLNKSLQRKRTDRIDRSVAEHSSLSNDGADSTHGADGADGQSAG